MPQTINRDLPDDIAGWRQAVERAKNIYWLARRDGKTENEALKLVLDDCLRDQFNDDPDDNQERQLAEDCPENTVSGRATGLR